MSEPDNRVQFPDPRQTGPDGLIAIGGRLDTRTLSEAYETGIFPWPERGLPLLWFSPPERGIIDLRKEIHWSHSFKKRLRSWLKEDRLEIRLDTAFSDVIRSCKEASRKGQSDTWILDEMEAAYTELHRQGFAHSVEVYLDGVLSGGLYGVFFKGVFSGESMFHHKADAGKVALAFMIQDFIEHDFDFLDVQMVTPVVEAFGGVLVSRDEFLLKLENSQDRWDRKLCHYEWIKGCASLSSIHLKLNAATF